MNRKIQSRRSNRAKRDASKKPLDASFDSTMTMAFKMWDSVKARARDDPSFIDMKDTIKIDLYEKSEFKDFYTSFPLVSRYMICMGQFTEKAFTRFLKKRAVLMPANQQLSEDDWLKSQAFYIRYLWESYQKKHFNMSDAQKIYDNAYETLTKETADFKAMHDNIEKKLETDEKRSKSEMVKEVLGRLVNQEQSLDTSTTRDLIYKLQKRVDEQRRKSVIAQINNDVALIRPTRMATGLRKELKPRKSTQSTIVDPKK